VKDKNHNTKDDISLKKRKEQIIKKREDKHDLSINTNKENLNGKGKCIKKNTNTTVTSITISNNNNNNNININNSTTTTTTSSSTTSLEPSVPIVKTTFNNKPGTAPKRNCLSASSNSSYSSTSTSSSNSTSESVKNLSQIQRTVHRKYCETVKLKNQKKQMEQQLDHQNSANTNKNLKLFFKDKVVLLNIGTLTGKYFQIEAFWTDTIGDLKEIIQDLLYFYVLSSFFSMIVST